MQLQRTALLLSIVFLTAAAPLPAQVRQKIPEVNFQREFELDDQGHRQWKRFEVGCGECRGAKVGACKGCKDREIPKCTECAGSKRAKCRTCSGTGAPPDPLVEVICPYCTGTGWFDCAQCVGAGHFKVGQQDGSTTTKKCGSCKEVGRFRCEPCKGKRRIPTVSVKRKPPTEAKLKDLREAREALAECEKKLLAMNFEERSSKIEKQLLASVKKASKLLPALRHMQKTLQVTQKGLTKAAAIYEQYDSKVLGVYYKFTDRSIYLIRHQLRVLDLCIARAEFNEKADSGGL